MLLAAEVGNTNTSIGIFRDAEGLAASYRLSTERDRMPDEWYALLVSLLAADGLTLDTVDGVIISSVVPAVTTWLVAMARQRLGIDPIVVTAALDVGLGLDVEEPRQLGADRIVDCVAAYTRFGGPAIIIDLGTATTFDVIAADGTYKGGAIAAGVATSLRALATNAAQLFNVELAMPERVIGRNTADQLRAGIVAGHLAMLEGMIARIRRELGAEAQVIITGGLAQLFAGRSPLFDHYEPDLTLGGLRLIYDRVTGSRLMPASATGGPNASPSVSGAFGRGDGA
ncbi:MAG: type III pantothenate kinase [Thermomicrobiales bacterium]|nr:type III pantothenate kinase [Thermomicrobiales bacterium]